MSNLPFESYQSGEYLTNNPTWDFEDTGWKASQVLKLIRANALAPKSLVEVGCGSGGVLATLKNALPQVSYSGYEIASDASRFWEQYKDSGIQFRVADFLAETSPRFDMLLLLDVMEHVANPFEFLKGLGPRADYFVFHVPLDLSAVSVARETPILNVRHKVGHIHYFTKGIALSLLGECGFEVVDWFYTGASFSAPQKTWKTRLASIPRRMINAINRDLGVRLLGGDTLMVLARYRG